MKSFSVILLVFLFAIVHVTDGAVVRGSTTTTKFVEVQELQEANAAVNEPRKLKGNKKGGMKGKTTTGGGTTTTPVVVQQPVVECEGCCCSFKDGVSKCCGKTCASGILCL